MTKTIEDMKESKGQLEQDILKQLQEFERSYGVAVDRVGLGKSYTIGDINGRVAIVNVEVKI